MSARRRSGVAAALAGLLALAGCADAPLPGSEAVSWQPQLNAADHWRGLAEDVAERTVAFTREGDRYAGKPVHVARPDRPSPFDRGFRALLEEQLVQRGVPVSARPGNAVVLSYDVTRVRHDRGGGGIRPTGLLTAGGGLAGLSAFGPGQPTSELLFSASVRDSEMLVFRAVRIYYVPDGDLGLYGAGSGGPDREGDVRRADAAGESFSADGFEAADTRCLRTDRIALLVEVAPGNAAGGDDLRFRCVRDSYLDTRS